LESFWRDFGVKEEGESGGRMGRQGRGLRNWKTEKLGIASYVNI